MNLVDLKRRFAQPEKQVVKIYGITIFGQICNFLDKAMKVQEAPGISKYEQKSPYYYQNE